MAPTRSHSQRKGTANRANELADRAEEPHAKAHTSHRSISMSLQTKRKRKADIPQETNGQGEREESYTEKTQARATRPTKQAKKSSRPADAGQRPRYPRIGKTVNEPPTVPLNVYVFGEGDNGELGLGNELVDGKKPVSVKRPRLHWNLPPSTIGVAQVACGGMHSIALTKDNTLLTWGVNDQWALGRDTSWDGGERDIDDNDDEPADDGSGLNPSESKPGPVDITALDPEIRWTQVVASDSASFALTQDGKVYGWGTFRASDGVIGFSESTMIQKTPVLLPDLKDVRRLAAGVNHVLALDGRGRVFSWGCGQQNQLARRAFEGHLARLALRPASIGPLPVRGTKAAKIACGSYHSFAIDEDGRVFGWGLNNFAELGIADGAGEAEATQLRPRFIESLQDYKIVDIVGGEHHSLACTDDGRLLAWGRIDSHQVGLRADAFNQANAIYDERGHARILAVPTVIPDLPPIVAVAAGTDHSLALSADGQAYAWGFSTEYQTGLGTKDPVEKPTLIDNSAVRGKHLTFASAGGQFSVLACPAELDA